MPPINSPHHLFEQLKSNYLLISLTIAVSALLMGMVLLIYFGMGIPLEKLTRDPNAISELPVYTGFFSQIGIFFWAASATICCFSSYLLSGQAACYKLKRFLMISGLLTLFLGLDDVFQFHETLFPDIGIPQNLVLISYIGLVFFYFLKFYSLILETEYILLAIALFLFSISVIIDVFHLPIRGELLLEDGAKLSGIVSWLAYFFRVGSSSINHSR